MVPGLPHGPEPKRFRLSRYFTLASLAAFTLVAIALFFLEREERTFLTAVQREQGTFFAQAQAELVREQKAAARGNLLAQHEAGHVTLAGVAAKALWQPHFAPLAAKAGQLPADHCRAAGQGPGQDDVATANARQACFSRLGERIRSLPGFAAADAAVRAMLSKGSVFKIKVYDRRGLTVYSSELAQVGEDKATNKGWISAIDGTPVSELVHRDRFSAFEGVVENRDLIQSYVPVLASGGEEIIGVFEIYSDVTPLLAQAHRDSARISDAAAANQAKLEAAARLNEDKVLASSNLHFAIVGGLLALLYAVLTGLVRAGQRIIDEQARAREQAALREQRWHHEKMAALATLAANASHEVGNPLAVIVALAEDIARAQEAGQPLAGQPQQILEQASRIAAMTRGITEFAATRSEEPGPVDVNEMVRAVCNFLGFDSRYRGTTIETRLDPQLPACMGAPEHLNEALMGLLQGHTEASGRAAGPGGRIVVETLECEAEVMIRIGCECVACRELCALDAADARLESARRRVEGMAGRIVSRATSTEVLLQRFAR